MILTLCTSRKAVSGPAGRPSAARTLRSIVAATFRKAGLATCEIDFSSIELPHFEGVALGSYHEHGAMALYSALSACTAVVIAAPAYWGGISGPTKNFLDLTGGAEYGAAVSGATPWTDRQVFLLVVGAQPGDSERGEEQMRESLRRLGARVSPITLTVDRPQTHDPQELLLMAARFGTAIARIVE